MPPRVSTLGLALVLEMLTTAAAAQQQDPTVSPATSAGVTPTADRPLQAQSPPPAEQKPVKLRWRDTWLIWDNAVTAQTIGIGKDYQSSNPMYEMTGSLRPRYYIYDGEVDAFYAAGRIDVVREFTNSDVTTKRGETTLSDAVLLTAYRRTLATSPGYETIVTAALPILTFPTSKFSMANGTIMGLGTEARLTQSMPLAGGKWPVFKTLTLGAVAGYNHTFTVATHPTNPDLRRVRLTPEGRTAPGDQLVGVAFPAHELHVNARLIADITERVALFVEASYRPTWKYGFSDAVVCPPMGTGTCTVATSLGAHNTYVPVTSFEADLWWDVLDELTLDVGYVNIEVQPGLDGQRRSVFYSPGSQFYLSVIGHLDAIYLAATGRKPEAAGSATHLRP